MALPKITFTKQKGGLGRVLPGEDHISGFIFYNDTKPSGFSSDTSYVERVLSLTDAENLGIVNTNIDETKATATIIITSASTIGQNISIAVGSTILGTYDVTASASAALEAQNISDVINANTYSHKYISIASGSTITITAPAGLGISLNTIALTITTTSTVVPNTTTAFAGGVASLLAQYHYQISEAYRLNPNLILYIMIADIPTTYFATEILEIQKQANGAIRQLAVFANAKTSITTSDVSALHNAIVATEDDFGVSFSAVYSTDLMALTDVSNLPDLSSLNAFKVSVLISQSFSGVGLNLKNITGKSVPTLGAALGTISYSKVSESIGWIGKFPISDGVECEIVGFSNGQLYNSISKTILERLQGYRFIYLRKFTGTSGSFWSDSNCSVSVDSDYSFIENNRTIDKAIRGIRKTILPELNSPLLVNTDGTLTDATVAGFKNYCNETLELMRRAGELSAYQTDIDANQDVLATSEINIQISIVPLGVARQINISIGFKTKL